MPACMKNILKRILKSECGQSAAAVAISFTVLVGGAALAVDLGASYAAQQKLQNAADEAAIAAARTLSVASNDTSGAVSQALNYAELNGAERENVTVTTPYRGDPYKVEVICSREMPYSLATVFGSDSGTVSARAVAECTPLRGPFDYTLFSGSETQELPINVDRMSINGSVHGNQNVTMNSSDIDITGSVEAVNALTMRGDIAVDGTGLAKSLSTSGGAHCGSFDSGGAPVVDMPDFADLVRDASIAAGTYQNGSQRYNGSAVCVDDPIYVNGDVSFNTPMVISGNGVIIADGDITFAAKCVLAPGSSVCFYSKTGNINIWVDTITVDGLLYAPNGAIRFGARNVTINGRIIAKTLALNASNITLNSGEHDRDCLPRTEIALIE